MIGGVAIGIWGFDWGAGDYRQYGRRRNLLSDRAGLIVYRVDYWFGRSSRA